MQSASAEIDRSTTGEGDAPARDWPFLTSGSLAPPPDAALALMLLGAVLALAIMLPGALSGKSLHFLRTQTAQLFVGAIAIQMGIWAIVCVPEFRIVRWLWRTTRDGRRRLRAIAVAAGVFTVVAVPIIFTPSAETPFSGEAVKDDVVGCIGAVVMFLNILGIALVYCVAQEYLPGSPADGGSASLEDARRRALALYVALRRCLHRLVLVLGVMITLAVLSAAALQIALVSFFNGRQPLNYPASAIAYWGMYGAAVVAAVAVPYHLGLRGYAVRIRDVYYEVVPPGEPGYEERRRQRLEVDQFLGLNVLTMDAFRAMLTILAPVVSGLLPLFSSVTRR